MSRLSREFWRNLALLNLLVCVLLSVFAYLLWQDNRTLVRRKVPARAPIRQIRVGDQLPAFATRDVEGNPVEVLKRGGLPWLLFIYDTDCGRCEAAMDVWNETHAKLVTMGAKVQVLGLSVADSYATVQHYREHRLEFPVVAFPSPGMQKKYGITRIPITAYIGPDGIVKVLWDKPLTEGEKADVLEIACPSCFK